MKWLYLALDLGVLAGPLALSFDRRVAFYRHWRALGWAIAAMMALFVPWDMAFVALGIWGFDPRYVLGLRLGNLPIEEWLFFPVVAYACLFIYECLREYVRRPPLVRSHRAILLGIASVGLAVAVTHPLQRYTSLKLGATSLGLLAALYLLRPAYLSWFLLTYLVSLGPFLMMNGVLTGAGIPGQIVWYNPKEILGWRIGTIPVEDSFYSLGMLLLTTVVYEALRSPRERREK